MFHLNKIEQINPDMKYKNNLSVIIQKILKSARQKSMDLHVNIGPIISYSHEQIKNANWKYLLFMENCLFVECTESTLHYNSKLYLSGSFSSEQNSNNSRIETSAEVRVPYHHKFTCGLVQYKYMDASLYVFPDLVPLVAGEVGYCGQSLETLAKLCANYLTERTQIEISVGLWISPKSEHFKSKIFVFGRISEKSEEKYLQLVDAVENENYGIFADEYINSKCKKKGKDKDGDKDEHKDEDKDENKDENKNKDVKSFNKIDFTQFNCVLLAYEKFTEFLNIESDFLFQHSFIDYSNVERNFTLKFRSEYKKRMLDAWKKQK